MVGDLLRDSRAAGKKRSLLFVFFVRGNGFQVLSFEDLAAVQTLNIVDAVTPGNNFGTVMVTHTN
jgi:hypothetical protein